MNIKKNCNTAVLFITFARPEYARVVFDSIKRAKPRVLYFYSNMARENHESEKRKNEEIRQYIKEIEWDCDLKTFFREKHVDIYSSLFSAIDWVFDNEEQAIILEEDCVASLAFFGFCDYLLQKYKNDQRIWVISGNNLVECYNPNDFDYFFSSFPYLYGWASWKDRWEKVDRNTLPYEKIKKYFLFNQIYINRKAVKSALNFTKLIRDTPAWDYRMQMSMKCNGGVGIIPRYNLVKNIGLYGSHNKGVDNVFCKLKFTHEDTFDIKKEPYFVVTDYGYNQYYLENYYLRNKRIGYRLLKKVKIFIKKFKKK